MMLPLPLLAVLHFLSLTAPPTPTTIPHVSVFPIPGRSRQVAHWQCLEQRLHRGTGPGSSTPGSGTVRRPDTFTLTCQEPALLTCTWWKVPC